jgi:Holliday junction resolvase-like predicted endonuclease
MEKISNVLAGRSGEYLAASELCRRGYNATLTMTNAEAVDILAANKDGDRVVSIQVKTNQNSKNYWLLGEKNEKLTSKQLFYVFINMNNNTEQKPEFYIVPSKIVAETIIKGDKEFKAKGGKSTSMRQFNKDEKYRDNWEILFR